MAWIGYTAICILFLVFAILRIIFNRRNGRLLKKLHSDSQDNLDAVKGTHAVHSFNSRI